MAVGFFTNGIEFKLPHPPVPDRTMLLLCNVIKRAWQLLIERPPTKFDLKSADEDTITQVLVEIVENRLRRSGEIAGFDTARFGKVSREPKITNVDKKHPDKMPDIFFDLRRDQYSILSDQDGLFVECKPIDGKHPIVSCYCKKGLERFVIGDYAWAMQNALMVGYVNSDPSFAKLATALNNVKETAALNTIDHAEINKFKIYRSRHRRCFEWPGNHSQACQISVAHIWLDRN